MKQNPGTQKAPESKRSRNCSAVRKALDGQTLFSFRMEDPSFAGAELCDGNGLDLILASRTFFDDCAEFLGPAFN